MSDRIEKLAKEYAEGSVQRLARRQSEGLFDLHAFLYNEIVSACRGVAAAAAAEARTTRTPQAEGES